MIQEREVSRYQLTVVWSRSDGLRFFSTKGRSKIGDTRTFRDPSRERSKLSVVLCGNCQQRNIGTCFRVHSDGRMDEYGWMIW